MSRASIFNYITARAAQHDAAADKSPRNAPYHRGSATMFRALADDIAAKLDQVGAPPPLGDADAGLTGI